MKTTSFFSPSPLLWLLAVVSSFRVVIVRSCRSVNFRLSLTISVVTALWSRSPVVVLQIGLILLKSRPTFQFIQRIAIRFTRLLRAMNLLCMEPVVTDAVLLAPPLIFPSAKYKGCNNEGGIKQYKYLI